MAAEALGAEAALWARDGALARAGERWGRLAHGAALAFVVTLYANPMYWFPAFERARLGLGTALLCAGAVVMRRLTSGERMRLGGPASALLLAGYGGIALLSLSWTIAPHESRQYLVELAKLMLLYVALQNAVDTPSRLRRFLVVAALASLAPSIEGIRTWRSGLDLVEGFRTHWLGIYRDPNRLAMSLVAVLPFTVASFAATRRAWLRALLAFTLAAQIAAVVLTHSRSGAVAAAVALGLYLLRGGVRGAARGLVVASALAVGVAVLAPRTFWERESTIADYREDASVQGRQNAWKVLGAIARERPLSGVGAGAFYFAWDRYAPLSAGGHHLVAHTLPMEIQGELGAIALLSFAAFVAWLALALWRAGADPLVGREARAVFAAFAGYFVCELVNGYSLSWFLYFLFACGVTAVRLSRLRQALGTEVPSA